MSITRYILSLLEQIKKLIKRSPDFLPLSGWEQRKAGQFSSLCSVQLPFHPFPSRGHRNVGELWPLPLITLAQTQCKSFHYSHDPIGNPGTERVVIKTTAWFAFLLLLLLNAILFFKILFTWETVCVCVCVCLCKRAHNIAGAGGRGCRGRGKKQNQTPRWAGSLPPAPSQDPGIMTWATTKSQTLNQLSHPGALAGLLLIAKWQLPNFKYKQITTAKHKNYLSIALHIKSAL